MSPAAMAHAIARSVDPVSALRRVLAAAVVAGLVASVAVVADAPAAPKGLVAAYSFSEGTGTKSADESGNGNAATLTNVTWAGGKYGKGVTFNGASSLAQIADSTTLDLSSGMTVEAWIRPTSTSGTQTLVAKTRSGGGFPFGLELDGGKASGFVNLGGKSIHASGQTAVQANTWQFVATTFDGSRLRTYINGTKVADVAASGSMSPSSNPLEIGGNSVWGEHFNGTIDNVRVYSRALSATELASDRTTDVAAPAPTPTPTPSPTPAPPPTATTNCMPNPSACGFPDVETTGVKPGTALTPVNGTVTLSTPGQIFENKVVTGSITVTAPNVTIRNVKLVVTDQSYGIRSFGWQYNTSGLLVEDVEIDLNGHNEAKGIAFDGYTLRRAFIHNGSDCAHFGAGVAIEDTLCTVGPDANDDGMPDNTTFCTAGEPNPPHWDGFQSDGGSGITLSHNTIRNPCHQTSAILMSTNTSGTSGIRDVTIKNNLMAGGGYTLYCNAGPDVPNETVTGNRFARTWWSKSGYWGPTANCEDADVFSGNVWDDTNAAM